MRTKYVTVGFNDENGDPKYSNGKCRIRTLVLQGDPDTVQKAEKCRREMLRQEAAHLYNVYMDCSTKELDELFRIYKVSCLSELMQTRILHRMFVLLAYREAEEVLEICSTNFGTSLEMSVMPVFPDITKKKRKVRKQSKTNPDE